MVIRVEKEVEFCVDLVSDDDGAKVVVTDEAGDEFDILYINNDGTVEYNPNAVEDAGLEEV